jgi:NADPH-dependent curcumin reductase
MRPCSVAVATGTVNSVARMTSNRRWLLHERPLGSPTASTFRMEEAEVPELADGEALVRVIYFSLDPAMRGWINGEDTYVAGVRPGDVMRAGGVGEVVASRSDRYPVGASTYGMTGWQDYAIAGPGNPMQVLPEGTPLRTTVGTFGTTGLTAYFGLLRVGALADGETVLVSGAAGATGSIAGQIAKLKGCRVVGTAGGPQKCALLGELGFDAAIDYRLHDDPATFAKAIREACPDGVDVVFDNTGGPFLEAAISRINERARIVLCGAISQYNTVEPPPGPRNYLQLILKRARMEGFIVIDYRKEFPAAIAEMAEWMREGTLRQVDTVVEGLERAPEAFDMLFSGGNLGKLMVQVADE